MHRTPCAPARSHARPRLLTLTISLTLLTAMPSHAAGSPGGSGGGSGGRPSGELAGNNLSFPVVWAEGIAKPLPGTPGQEPSLNGAWMWWWGTEESDPNVVPLSAWPDPDNPGYKDDGIPLSWIGMPIPLHDANLVSAFIQKDPANVWQAETLIPESTHANPMVVDWIDWGDNLESVNWHTRSQVRTEVVLFAENKDWIADNPATHWKEYEMRHVSGWGIDEVHGLACDPAFDNQGYPGHHAYRLGPGNLATVYSCCARLTIQKLLAPRGSQELTELVWIPKLGWTGSTINPPVFNMAVYEGGDGPGYYSAEINVKGRVIYGYTWNVRNLHDPTGNTAAGDYRITFSFDANADGTPLNTAFWPGQTQIAQSADEAETKEDSGASPAGGAQAVIDFENNLTYIDIRILERSTGSGEGGGSGRGRRK